MAPVHTENFGPHPSSAKRTKQQASGELSIGGIVLALCKGLEWQCKHDHCRWEQDTVFAAMSIAHGGWQGSPSQP